MKTILLKGLTFLIIQAVVMLFSFLNTLDLNQSMVVENNDEAYDQNDWGL